MRCRDYSTALRAECLRTFKQLDNDGNENFRNLDTFEQGGIVSRAWFGGCSDVLRTGIPGSIQTQSSENGDNHSMRPA
jgi:hypothetical protein